MKMLCSVFIVMFLSVGIANGEIKNGYTDVEKARVALASLLSADPQNRDVEIKHAKRVKDRIQILTDYIIYFELTEILLNQFRQVCPSLYQNIDTIKDGNSKSTDVYIKFIPQNPGNIQHPGTSFIKHISGDNTCYSEYGPNSVSIKIWIMDTSLTILAHELGHVAYEIPNLTIYKAYYEENYQSLTMTPGYIGHYVNDLSGKSAALFERQFSEDRKIFIKSSRIIISPFKILKKVRGSLQFSFMN